MNNVPKLLIYLVIFLIILNMVQGFFLTNNKIGKALTEIDSLKKQVMITKHYVEDANRHSDTLSKILANYSLFLANINVTVQTLDASRRLSDQRYRSERSQLSREIDSLENQIDSLRTNLPSITILP
jgi:hypothetical protein